MSATEWSELGVSGLPTGTVTLLLADVEGSTRLWETQPDDMKAAIARLDTTLADLVAAHNGVRPVEQGEGDSFVLAFARASDAVASALALQRAPLAPIRLRVGINTGEIQLRDEGNYIGPTINRTARLRDLAHGGQTVLSGATESMVLDHLPDDSWLNDLGTHPLRGLPRPERVVQLCHPDIRNEFPPLRTVNAAAAQNLPVQLTSFVGREEQMADVRQLLDVNRLVTLTGAGGVGKTRMALQVAAVSEDEFENGTRYVDLAPITDAAVVPVTMARALGLPDQPGRSTTETIVGAIGDRQILVVLDNCEHLLDASAELILVLAASCSKLTLLATSREPIGIAGEVTWRVPSLSLADESLELFIDRARLVRHDFVVTDEDAPVVAEICRRLDGIPLAIELAAARVRALSLDEIKESLHDRFRLLTGGSRTAVRRQQTLRASVDWSHALLTGPERALFRRLAVFLGGFDLQAAQVVCAGGDVERHQILDQLTLLVDKSLVFAESASGRTRYRLLETVRQYALEKLGESGEADNIRTRHREYYTAMVAPLEQRTSGSSTRRIEQAEIEIDNLRAAFSWCRENVENEKALQLACSLLRFWLTRGRVHEGLSWFEAVLCDGTAVLAGVAPEVRARVLADKAFLDAWGVAAVRMDQAQEALQIARELDQPALLARALSACAAASALDADVAGPYFAEAIEISRASGDLWRLSQIFGWQTYSTFIAGDAIALRAAGAEGQDVADTVGDPFASRMCRLWGVGGAGFLRGDLTETAEHFHELVDEARSAGDLLHEFLSHIHLSYLYAYRGEPAVSTAEAEAAIEAADRLGSEFYEGLAHMALVVTALAADELDVAEDADVRGWPRVSVQPQVSAMYLWRRAVLAQCQGDLEEALRIADEGASSTAGYHRVLSLAARARIALAQDDTERAERDAYAALTCAAESGAFLEVPDVLECIARVAVDIGSHREAARLFGAADAMRQRNGIVRFKVYDAEYNASVAKVREALGRGDFEAARSEGAALSTEEAIAYAQRGRGERKRPSSGWASLTPTELDVVRLVAEGLGNKDIAARLFISHRTVQTHLTHVYTKLGLSSRVQLAQEAARHNGLHSSSLEQR